MNLKEKQVKAMKIILAKAKIDNIVKQGVIIIAREEKKLVARQ